MTSSAPLLQVAPVGNLVPVEPEPEQPAGGETQSWDAFWLEVKGAATETIRGVEVRVPTGMTLAAYEATQSMADRGGWDGFAPLALSVFRAADGTEIPDLVDRWRAAGMELDELQTVVAWGMAHAQGRPVTFAEAYQITREAAEGKAQAGTTARGRSAAATGGRSKRTSGASTSTRRKTSRA